MSHDLNLQFFSRESLECYIKEVSASKGYFVSIKRSRSGKVWLKCDLGGTYQHKENLNRETSSRLIGCPFEIVGRYFKKGNYWSIVEVADYHSHEPSADAIGHSVARRFTPEEKDCIGSLAKNNVKVPQILNVLRSKYNNYLSTSQDVHNELQRQRQLQLQGKSPILVLYESLHADEYSFAVELNDDGSLKTLFFTYRDSLLLIKRWSFVLRGSCT
jgi:hypothetical protein